MGIVFVVEPLAHKRVAVLASRDPDALLRRVRILSCWRLRPSRSSGRSRGRTADCSSDMTKVSPAIPRRSAASGREWRGPTILSRGFRPFFLAAGVWALAGMAVWPPFFAGEIVIPTAFLPIDWHAHEMIFGYGGAAVAGFLLTAIPNWTGRLPVAGTPLAALAALWAAGRIAVFVSDTIGRVAAAAIDAAFLVVFAVVVAREVIVGHNWRNLKVVGVVAALATANIAFHVEDARSGLADTATRAALGLIVLLILLVGGRVTPSFTANWFARTGAAERPASFGKADGAVMGLSVVSVALWVVVPEGQATGALALAACVGNLWRLARWRGFAARRDALVLVLHLGFLFAALGFAAAAAHALTPSFAPYDAGVHVWAVGAIGMMTLAMMTRATLGHSGRALVASRGTQFAYACIVVAVVSRVAMSALPTYGVVLMQVAAGFWMLAFAAFLFVYTPLLVGRVQVASA